MSKKYDYRKLKSYRSYKIRDICRVFRDKKLHEQTIRSWIKKGDLTAFCHGKTIYIYGAILKSFLKERSSKGRNSLKFDEFKCWTCKIIGTFNEVTISSLVRANNGCIVANLICPSCEVKTQRNYKSSEESKILKQFTVEYNELEILSDSLCSTRKTNIDVKPNMPVSESLKNDIPYPESENTSSSKKTHIGFEQLTLFEL